MRIPVTGLDRSAQERIDERRHQIDGIGVTARYEPLQAGAGDERRPRLLALVPQTAEESSQRTQNDLSVLGRCVHSRQKLGCRDMITPREDHDICEIALTRCRNPSLDHRDDLFRQNGGQWIPEQVERAIEQGRILDIDRMGRHRISDIDIEAENHLRAPMREGTLSRTPE